MHPAQASMLVVALSWLPVVLCADEIEEVKSLGLKQTPTAAAGLLETAAGLLLVLGIIFVLAWAVRRLGRLPIPGKGLVQVLGGTTLGARERVVLVQVEEVRLVLGVAPGSIRTLHVLDQVDVDSATFSSQLDLEMSGSER